MNLDRLTPKSIRENNLPVETMLDTLESFADASGGPLWRQHRVRKTELRRTLALYLDEEYELLNPEERKPQREEDSEEIEISFSAERMPVDDDENDFADFSNVYTITHSISLPLPDMLAIPEHYRQELQEALAEEVEDGAVKLPHQEDKLEPDMSNAVSVIETNTLKYTIDQMDGSIAYDQYVDYSCGDILIKGAEYSPELDTVTVHGEHMDEHSDEWLTLDPGVTEDCADTVEERIFIFEDMQNIVSDQRNRMDLIGRTSEEHAIRVLALLSLIGANIRRRRLQDSSLEQD